ncbi:hypothetical protein STEG23_009773 [Scotinomys teguina]
MKEWGTPVPALSRYRAANPDTPESARHPEGGRRKSAPSLRRGCTQLSTITQFTIPSSVAAPSLPELSSPICSDSPVTINVASEEQTKRRYSDMCFQWAVQDAELTPPVSTDHVSGPNIYDDTAMLVDATGDFLKVLFIVWNLFLIEGEQQVRESATLSFTAVGRAFTFGIINVDPLHMYYGFQFSSLMGFQRLDVRHQEGKSIYNKYRHQSWYKQNHQKVLKYDWQMKASVDSFTAIEQPNGTCLKRLNTKT